MRYKVSENLSDRNGVVSNLHCFLMRSLDTGFKTKWSGLWSPPYKYLDYYGIRINGIWLDSDSVQAVEYGDQMTLHHDVGGIRVKENIAAPSDTPGIEVTLELESKNKEKKAAHVMLEAGVDIRHKSQDISHEDYNIETGPNRVRLARGGKNLMITSEEELNLKGDPYQREHFPGEKQECIVPGKIFFKKELENVETINFRFTTSEGSFGSIEKRNQNFEHDKLDRLFKYSITSVKNLIYDKEGIGINAGHPWFQSYWARDTFWTLMGLIDAGYFELSEDILTNFAKRENIPGKINLEGENRTKYSGESDTSPLYLIAADKLERHFRINDQIQDGIQKAKHNLEIDQKGVALHSPEGTWMDTLNRERAVEIQSLWLEAAKRHNMDEKDELKKGLNRFKREDYIKDSLRGDDMATINPAIPLMYGQIQEGDARRYLEKINAEFSSRYGARTVSMLEPDYSSDGYHTGSSWGLTTAWAAAANLRYGNNKQGLNMLGKLRQFLDRGQLGALPEVVDSEDGENLGCSEQAWSSGLIPHIVDSYIIGIKARDPNKVVIDPIEGLNCLRTGKKIGDSEIDIKVSEGEPEVLNNPELKVIIED